MAFPALFDCLSEIVPIAAVASQSLEYQYDLFDFPKTLCIIKPIILDNSLNSAQGLITLLLNDLGCIYFWNYDTAPHYFFI